MKRLFASRAATAALSSVLTLLLAGGGYAIASGSGGKITVCVNSKTGALYKAAMCKKHSSKLTWNQTGPAGARGAPGAPGGQGIQGIPGPTGPSNGYSNYGAGDHQVSIGTTPTTVASLALPAGAYILSAEATLDDTVAELNQCQIVSPTGSELAVSYGSTDATSIQSINTEFAPLTLTSAGTVALKCYSNDVGAQAEAPHLTAIQVGTVTGS